jgi:hypothetical protein
VEDEETEFYRYSDELIASYRHDGKDTKPIELEVARLKKRPPLVSS